MVFINKVFISRHQRDKCSTVRGQRLLEILTGQRNPMIFRGVEEPGDINRGRGT
jgi:hypothetical protein